MARHKMDLTPSNRKQAIAWIDKAIQNGKGLGKKPWVMEVREETRNDEQNKALWSLIDQILKQSPSINGFKYDRESLKCAFMQAVGVELRLIPNLDGGGVFPMGHKSSQLTVSEFSNLVEFILGWAAERGLTINHFDA